MNLIEAINKVKSGSAIISNTGIIYTPDQLYPIWCGEHYASFQTCNMTKIEREGNFEITSR